MAFESCCRSTRRRHRGVRQLKILKAIFFSFRFWAKLFIFISFLVVSYIEVVSYSILPLRWIEAPDCKPPECVKLLLVADPQILGSEKEGHTLINFFAKWDCDRYIRRTFLQAFNYVRPDVVIFLGDLMDEGGISSDEEFFNDLRRFLAIFPTSTLMVDIPKVLLPGDNDIGGVDDIMIPHAVHRFRKIFNQSDGPLLLNSLQFYKVNYMTSEIQEPYLSEIHETDVRIALSHVPLLPRPKQMLSHVVQKIRPHLIFSGHTHVSAHFIAPEANLWRREYVGIMPNETRARIFRLRAGLIHEIIVPTCSYRMGVKNMGYGAAFIDTQKKLLHYNVLWLPRRFTQLFTYLAIIFTWSFFLFLYVLMRSLRRIRTVLYCCCCCRRNHSSHFVPL